MRASMKVEVATVGSAELSNAVVAPKPAEPEPRAAPENFEIRIPKSETKPNFKCAKLKDATRVLNLLRFGEFELVSDFEFGASELESCAFCAGFRG